MTTFLIRQDFFFGCAPEHNKLCRASANCYQGPPRPVAEGCFHSIGPTFLATGWIYRRPLIKFLLEAFEARTPPLNALDVWVYEVMAQHDLLPTLYATPSALVRPLDIASVKEMQDLPRARRFQIDRRSQDASQAARSPRAAAEASTPEQQHAPVAAPDRVLQPETELNLAVGEQGAGEEEDIEMW